MSSFNGIGNNIGMTYFWIVWWIIWNHKTTSEKMRTPMLPGAHRHTGFTEALARQDFSNFTASAPHDKYANVFKLFIWEEFVIFISCAFIYKLFSGDHACWCGCSSKKTDSLPVIYIGSSGLYVLFFVGRLNHTINDHRNLARKQDLHKTESELLDATAAKIIYYFLI